MNVAMMEESQLNVNEALHFENIFQNLVAMKRNSENCDIIIRAEGRNILVHKNILCAASDYFDAMFSPNNAKKPQGVVRMEELTYAALKKCINFIYSGRIAVSRANCEEVLYAARLMQLNEVSEKTALYLQNCITVNSFFDIKRIADKFSLTDLIKFCNHFAIKHFLLLTQTEEFKNVGFDYLSSLMMAVRNPSHEIEDAKLSVALQWIKNDLDKREIYLMKLASLVDVSKLKVSYCKYLYEKEQLCHRSDKLLWELYCRFTVSKTEKSTGPPDLKKIHRSSHSNSLLLFNASCSEVVRYNHSDISITKIVNYHTGFESNQLTSCVVHSCLCVFLENKSAYWISLDNITSWKPLNDMLHCHGQSIQCTVFEGSIYVGGGNRLERYILKESKWENVDLDDRTCNESAIVSDDRAIYIIGGKDHEGYSTNIVSKYSPSASWTTLPPMHSAKKGASAIFLNGSLFVASGFDERVFNFEMFDGESWTVLSHMACPRTCFQLCLLHDKIFAVSHFTLESYDVEDDSWKYSFVGPCFEIDVKGTVSLCTEAHNFSQIAHS